MVLQAVNVMKAAINGDQRFRRGEMNAGGFAGRCSEGSRLSELAGAMEKSPDAFFVPYQTRVAEDPLLPQHVFRFLWETPVHADSAVKRARAAALLSDPKRFIVFASQGIPRACSMHGRSIRSRWRSVHSQEEGVACRRGDSGRRTRSRWKHGLPMRPKPQSLMSMRRQRGTARRK